MRIAVTYDNGQIWQHFGKTEFFKLYDVEDGSITKAEAVSALLVGTLKTDEDAVHSGCHHY